MASASLIGKSRSPPSRCHTRSEDFGEPEVGGYHFVSWPSRRRHDAAHQNRPHLGSRLKPNVPPVWLGCQLLRYSRRALQKPAPARSGVQRGPGSRASCPRARAGRPRSGGLRVTLPRAMAKRGRRRRLLNGPGYSRNLPAEIVTHLVMARLEALRARARGCAASLPPPGDSAHRRRGRPTQAARPSSTR